MSISPSDVYPDNSLWTALPSDDPAKEVLASMLAGQFLSVAVHSEDSVRMRFLERLVPLLRGDHFRVIRTTNPETGPFDLRSLMHQVISPGHTDGPDAVEQFFAALTLQGAGESQLALIIDNAHLLTDQAFRYLDLLISITNVTTTSLHLMLLGQFGLWERLPASGHLTADKVSTSILLADEDVALDAGVREGTAPASTEADASIPFAAPGPGIPLKVQPTENLFAQTVAAQTKPQGVKSEPQADFMKRHGKSKTSSWGWAALGSAIVIGGGLAAIRLQDQQPIGTAVMRDTATQPSARGPGNADPAPFVDGTPPGNPKEAASVPARPDAPAAVYPADAGKPDKAETVVHSEIADEAVESAVGASPANPSRVVPPAAEKEPDMDARGAGVAPASFEPQQPEVSPRSSDATPGDAAAPAPIAPLSVASVPVASVPVASVPVVPMSTGPNANGIEELSGSPGQPKPNTASTAEPGLNTEQASFLPLSSSVLASLLARGNMLLADGDVVAARLMFERAAVANSGPAALALGQTYDPRFLAGIGAQSVTPDPRRAMIWYQRASDLGSAEAIPLLAKLSAQNGK